MSQLKPGYWRTPHDQTLEVLAERDGFLFGRWVENNAPFTRRAGDEWDYEYLGPTLPPDPGEGWRLLKKWPEMEPVIAGDDFLSLDGTWHPIGMRGEWRQCDGVWYRRRVAPTPPDGWELLPDGTEWQDGFKRYSTVVPYWTGGGPYTALSGKYKGAFVWYARRITPEPQWEPTGNVRWEAHVVAINVPHIGAYDGEGTWRQWTLHRQLRRGDETRWEPVPVEDKP